MKKILLALVCTLCFMTLQCSGEWTVSGSTTTKTFNMRASEWTLRWDVQANEFGYGRIMIEVYDANTKERVAYTSASHPGPGETVVHQAGAFYMSITTLGSARVWAEE